MTLKMHIGIFVIIAMIFSLIRLFKDDLMRDFDWTAPIGGAFILFAIIESFGWAAWWFFIY